MNQQEVVVPVSPDVASSVENQAAAEVVRRQTLSALAAAVAELESLESGDGDPRSKELTTKIAQLTNRLTEFYVIEE